MQGDGWQGWGLPTQGEGWWGMPGATSGILVVTSGTQGQRLVSGSFKHLQTPLGVARGAHARVPRVQPAGGLRWPFSPLAFPWRTLLAPGSPASPSL